MASDITLPTDVKWVRLVFTDSAGLRRCRVVPAHRYLNEVQQHGVGLTESCMAMQSWGDVCAAESGLSAVGEVRMFPDHATLKSLPWCPSHAMVMVNMVKQPSTPWSCDPRASLSRVLHQLHTQHGLQVRLGFEHEFVLLHKPLDAQQQQQQQQGVGIGRVVPPAVDGTNYAQTRAVDMHAHVLDTMCDYITTMGINVEQYHAESAGGQFEIVTGHTWAMDACDDVIRVREALTAGARTHGLVLSLLPKLSQKAAGNGCHCHMSLYEDGKSIMTNDESGELSDTAQHFFAGILTHLPALLSFTMGSPNSFSRVQPGCWAGAYTCWGLDNKEAPLRLAAIPGYPASKNMEYKALDATANVYVAVAALLSAGMTGLRAKQPLPPPLLEDPHVLSEEARQEWGVVRLPVDMDEALKSSVEHDTGLLAALHEDLGQPLVNAYLGVKKSEERHYQRVPFQGQVNALYDKF